MQKLRVEMMDGTFVEVDEAQIGEFFANNKGQFKYDPIHTNTLPRKKGRVQADEPL